MTDLATALADNTRLTPYRGRPVVRTKIIIRNAGDGLTDSLGIDPQEFEPGEEVFVLLKCVAGPHKMGVAKGYEPDEPGAPFELTMDLLTRGATIVDDDYAGDRMRQQALRIQAAKDSANGVGRLDQEEGSDGWDTDDLEPGDDDEGPGATVHSLT